MSSEPGQGELSCNVGLWPASRLAVQISMHPRQPKSNR